MYTRTPCTSALRYLDRVMYDVDTVHAILDEAYVCHLSFIVDGEPRLLPMLQEDTAVVTPGRRLRILFAGHDFKFVRPLIEHYHRHPDYRVLTDQYRGHVIAAHWIGSAVGSLMPAQLTDPTRSTTLKQRFLGRAAHHHPQQILRVDRESRQPLELLAHGRQPQLPEMGFQ